MSLLDHTITDWDSRFLALAQFWAEMCSKDPRTRVGAVLVGVDTRDVALGYNGFPPGVADLRDRLHDRATKHKLTQHAERNVLDNAHFPTNGATLYSTRFPCSECAKSIVSKKVSRVVCPPPPLDDPVWAEDCGWTYLLFNEGEVVLYERDLAAAVRQAGRQVMLPPPPETRRG